MRDAIFNSLFARMAEDDSIFFVTADMGLGIVERFEQAYPDRYVNCGIAEQNMIGLAAGLSNVGYRVFCYTVSQFYLRAFEQIRNEIGINRAPLILLGTTEGFDNAALGPSHHPIDDWGVLKAVPGLDIYCPSSLHYAGRLIERCLASDKASYVRIAKGSGFKWATYVGHSDESGDVMDCANGQGDTVFVTYGGTLPQDCLNVLERAWPDGGTIVLNKLHPLPPIGEKLRRHRHIIVVEDQFPHIGLYASICQLDTGTARLTSIAPKDFDLVVGTSPAEFHRRYGMDVSRFVPTGAFERA